MKFTFLKYVVLLAVLVGSIVLPKPVAAVDLESDATAMLASKSVRRDERVTQLRSYLASYDSPMADCADHFVAEADRLGLDWRLVAAISGVESTFGIQIPTGSYNGWGWGVFTGASDGVHFTDWEDGITKVSEGLRNDYINRGAVTVEQIGRLYASSPLWTYKVRHYIDQITAFTPSRPHLIEVLL